MERKGRRRNDTEASQTRAARSKSAGYKGKRRYSNARNLNPTTEKRADTEQRVRPNQRQATAPNRDQGKGSNTQRNSRQKRGPQYEDTSEFETMMRKQNNFFNQKIFNNPTHLELTDEEFNFFLSDILQGECENNELRHQFLIQLCKTGILEMKGPICSTLMTYVRDGKLTRNREKLQNLKTLNTLLQEILVRIPHYKTIHANCAAINGLMKAIPDIEGQLNDQFIEIVDLLSDTNIVMNRVNNESTWPVDLSFIIEPLIPDLKVILEGSLDTKYQNIIKGPYKSQAHYLETWFRLMQEDFISPVRTAIKDFKQERHFKPDSKRMRLDGGYYYQFERILNKESMNDMVLYQLKFNLENLKHVDWKSSDRLRSDSLIFLSDDNFKTAYCGSIQKLRELPQRLGTVWVTMMDGKIPPRGGFDGIEAMPFFLPYECVLQRLRYIASLIQDKKDLPMQKYIVGCQKHVKAPFYMHPSTSLKMANGKVFKPDNIKTAQFGLDPSQTEAMELVLNHELAIIQGPPGCGKSYVGAIVVDILMQNKGIWQKFGHGCMMLMAYTNHAIDQFIAECEERGIDMSKTVRLGGRGNEQMEKYKMYKRRQELCQWSEYEDIIDEAKTIRRSIIEKDGQINQIEKLLKSNYEEFTYQDLSCYIAAPFSDQINMVYGDVNNDFIFEWLMRNLHGELNFTNSRIIAEDEAMQLQNADIFGLDNVSKVCLFRFWCEWAKLQARNMLGGYKIERERLKGNYEVVRRQQDVAVARRCNIIAMTTTGASKNAHLVEAVKPTIVLVEEAAEVLESHVVAPLTTGCKHLILIGDHQQLRPSISEFQLEKRNMAISLFERLIMNDIPHCRLDTQHRMHPDIAHILVPNIYPTLKHHPHVYTYPKVMGIPKRMVFLTHEHPEQQIGEKSSKFNDFEAELLVYQARYLLLQGYGHGDVTILTTYTGQTRQVKNHIDRLCNQHPDPLFTTAERLALLNEKFHDIPRLLQQYATFDRKNAVREQRIEEYRREKKEILSNERSKLRDIRVTTVDNYQGEESKIILLSFVRSNLRGDIGFLKSSNRICVALSRAKHGFYAVGNFKLFEMNQKSDIWKKLCKQLGENDNLKETLPIECLKHNTEQNVATGKDFHKLAPEGGCPKSCDETLSCGHTCTRKCHPIDPQHMTFKCQVPCPGTLSCDHNCLRECFRSGDKNKFFIAAKNEKASLRQCSKCVKEFYCDIKVDVPNLKCSHKGTAYCSDVHNYICQEKRQFDLSCGHQKIAPCNSELAKLEHDCRKEVLKTFPACLHTVKGACNKPITKFDCVTLVDKLMECGHHTLEVECLQSKTLQVCTKKIDVTLSCGHQQRVPCHEGTNALCNADVEKTLPCNHILIVKCCESTLPQLCSREVTIKAKCQIHSVKTKCSDKTKTQSQPCTIKVTSILLTCGHQQTRICHESEKPCTEMIKQNRLECTHYVRAKCHEFEASMKAPCAIRVGVKRKCGHYAHEVPCHQKNNSRTHRPQCQECAESDSDTDETEDNKKHRKALGLSRHQGRKGRFKMIPPPAIRPEVDIPDTASGSDLADNVSELGVDAVEYDMDNDYIFDEYLDLKTKTETEETDADDTASIAGQGDDQQIDLDRLFDALDI